jgi:hypothetical protein
VPRFPLACAVSTNLIATAILCASSLSVFAAEVGPAQTSAPGKNPPVGCDAKTTAPAAAEPQQAAESLACDGASAAADDRAYLLATASPGDTMMRQGPDIAIARLNPEFVTRLAAAIRDARQEGLPSAGVSSAYRPPGFGVGGFADKFNSLHSYGLAVDMAGIGEPGSKETKLWHEIAGRHGVICPYGADNTKEWNHCQATGVKKVPPNNPLRETITAQGPRLLDEMFKVGNAIIDELSAAINEAFAVRTAEHTGAAGPGLVRTAAVSRSERFHRRPWAQAVRAGRGIARKPVVLASLEPRHEKSARKSDEKPRGATRLRSASTESRPGASRRHAHAV